MDLKFWKSLPGIGTIVAGGVAVGALVGWGMSKATKPAPVATPKPAPLPGPIDPGTNLVLFSRFGDADLNTLVAPDANGQATQSVIVQVMDPLGNAQSIQVTGQRTDASGYILGWTGQVLGQLASGSVPGNFNAGDVAGYTTDGGKTWVTSKQPAGTAGAPGLSLRRETVKNLGPALVSGPNPSGFDCGPSIFCDSVLCRTYTVCGEGPKKQ